MAEKLPGWTPMSETEELFEASRGSVVNYLSLPVGLDTERILVHPRRIDRLVRFAGAKQLILAGAKLNDDVTPDMYDVEEAGGGMATLKGLKKRPKEVKSTATYDDTNNPMRYLLDGTLAPLDFPHRGRLAAYKADSLAMHIDTDVIQEKIKSAESSEQGLLDTKMWAKNLDKTVRSGLISASSDRYINGQSFFKFIDPLATIVWYDDIFNYVNTGEGPVLAGTAIGFKTIQLIAGTHRIRTGEAKMRDHNWSAQIWTHVRTDRLVMTALTARAGGRLFKAA